MSRTTRTDHNHLTQGDPAQPVDGCPACALIRPEVMPREVFWLVSAGISLPPVRHPEESRS